MACPISRFNEYQKIYEIKKRDKSKAIAIMVFDFEYLEKNTQLTNNQISFLKNHKNPFTILINKSKILDKNLLDIINNLDNSEIYEKIAFRVAHNFIQRRLITEKWPLFLTSANVSNNPEIFSTKEINKYFWELINNREIRLFAHKDFIINSQKKYSDIFEFAVESEEVKYFRK